MTYHKKVSVKFTPVKSWQVGAEKLAGWSRKVGRLKLTKLAGWGPPPDSKIHRNPAYSHDGEKTGYLEVKKKNSLS